MSPPRAVSGTNGKEVRRDSRYQHGVREGHGAAKGGRYRNRAAPRRVESLPIGNGDLAAARVIVGESRCGRFYIIGCTRVDQPLVVGRLGERRHRGVDRRTGNGRLSRLLCGRDHEGCGRPPTAAMRTVGRSWALMGIVVTRAAVPTDYPPSTLRPGHRLVLGPRRECITETADGEDRHGRPLRCRRGFGCRILNRVQRAEHRGPPQFSAHSRQDFLLHLVFRSKPH